MNTTHPSAQILRSKFPGGLHGERISADQRQKFKWSNASAHELSTTRLLTQNRGKRTLKEVDVHGSLRSFQGVRLLWSKMELLADRSSRAFRPPPSGLRSQGWVLRVGHLKVETQWLPKKRPNPFGLNQDG